MQRNTFSAVVPLLFLGLCAGFQVLAVGLYLKSNISVLIFILAISLTEGIYLLNRYTDDEDFINYPERISFFSKRSWMIFIAIAAAFTPSILLPVLGILNPLPVFLLVAIIGTFYSVKFFPVPNKDTIKWISLKNIPLIKFLIVTILWAGSGIVIAILFVDPNLFFRQDILTIFGTFVLTSINSTVLSDLRDKDGDKLNGIITIPTLLGRNGTCLLLAFLNIIGISVVVYLYGHLRIDVYLLIFCLFSIIWASTGALTFYISRLRKSRSLQEMLVDSHLLLSPLCLAIISLLKP